MYSITVESVTDEGFEFVRKYKAHEKAKAMDDWYHTVENLLPGREKGTLRGPNGIMSEYTPMSELPCPICRVTGGRHKMDCQNAPYVNSLGPFLENTKLRGLISEALSNMEYYPASLGEYWLVQDSDITAMQEALQEKGE